MHGIEFLQDLAVVMIVAGLVTVVFHRFKQPVVLGYILAGVIIGPHTLPLPLIKNQETIQTLAELGVILLMFSLGLEFMHTDLGRSNDINGPQIVPGAPESYGVGLRSNSIMARFNYLFGR